MHICKRYLLLHRVFSPLHKNNTDTLQASYNNDYDLADNGLNHGHKSCFPSCCTYTINRHNRTPAHNRIHLSSIGLHLAHRFRWIKTHRDTALPQQRSAFFQYSKRNLMRLLRVLPQINPLEQHHCHGHCFLHHCAREKDIFRDPSHIFFVRVFDG